MATIMEMPKLSDTMQEGSIAKWLKKEGEKVTAGSAVVEIETDKATMEYEAPSGGVLLKILVGDGGKCPLQSPIAVIGKAGENWEEVLEKYNAKKGKAPAEAANSAAKPATTAPAQTPTAHTPNTDSSRIKASPLAKKIASTKGIDLNTVQGSGPSGRIVQRDLDNAGTPTGSVATPVLTRQLAPGTVQKIPLTNMRKTIATRLRESVHQSPHFYLTVSMEMDAVLNWRKNFLKNAKPHEKFSVNDIMIFVVSRALKKHPEINSSWQEDHIAQYSDVHMSVAVALPTGLMTPVVRNADQLSLLEISQETKRLVKIARDGKLVPADYAGGTFSISNLGSMGIENFTAIINPPQAAILAVGTTVPTPVVTEEGDISVAQKMAVTLSCDHRVIDGAMGAEFLKTLKNYLEDPIAMAMMV